MNTTNLNIAKSMKKREYITFLKEALGFFHFLDNQGMKMQGSKNTRDKGNGLREFATLIDSQGKK